MLRSTLFALALLLGISSGHAQIGQSTGTPVVPIIGDNPSSLVDGNKPTAVQWMSVMRAQAAAQIAPALATKCGTDVSACTITVNGVTQSASAWFAGSSQIPPGQGTIGGVLTGNISWTVCANGCTFNSPLDAWNAARAIPHIASTGNVYIAVAHGVYVMTDQFYTDDPGMGGVHFIGDTAAPNSVVFQFTNVVGNNFSAFIITAGGKLGRSGQPGLAGLTLQAIGARTGASSWQSQSYGAGIHAIGAGASVFIDSTVLIDSFYYSALIEENASMIGDGASYTNAGDVNILARFGGSIQCDNCRINTASDINTDEYGGQSILGFNALAEAGGTLIMNGATAANAQVAAIAALNTGRVWAHDTTVSGGLFAGFRASENGVVEAVGATAVGNNTGAYAETGGYIQLDRTNIHDNKYDGVQVGFGGVMTGFNVNSHNNGSSGAGIGIRVLSGGNGSFSSTKALLVGNPTGPTLIDLGNGCTSTADTCNPASVLILN